MRHKYFFIPFVWLLFIYSCGLITNKKDDISHVLIVVMDGLRSDYITPEMMPNLYELAQGGAIATNHHVTYPTLTRVNAASLITGTYPEKHGLIHNFLYLPHLSNEIINTAVVSSLKKVEEMTRGNLITTVSLGELLNQFDSKLFIGSSGSTGSAYILNHKMTGVGIFNSNNFIVPNSNKRIANNILSKFPESNVPNYQQNRWAVNSYLNYGFDKNLGIAILWLTDPDLTTHKYGVGSQESIKAIKHVDAELGRIITIIDKKKIKDDINLIVTTDHGFTTNSGGFNLNRFISTHGLSESVEIIGDDQIYFNSNNEELAKQIIELLQSNSNVGAIFTKSDNDIYYNSRFEGTLSMNSINYQHKRSADVLVSPNWSDNVNEFGFPGTTSREGGVAGHSGANPFELQVSMIAKGPDFKQGVKSRVPSGNIDIMPTALYILGVDIPSTVQGRVLDELLVGHKKPEEVDYEIKEFEAVREWEDGFYKMKLKKMFVGKTEYVHEVKVCRHLSECE